jgi:hypothetical protein
MSLEVQQQSRGRQPPDHAQLPQRTDGVARKVRHDARALLRRDLGSAYIISTTDASMRLRQCASAACATAKHWSIAAPRSASLTRGCVYES